MTLSSPIEVFSSPLMEAFLARRLELLALFRARTGSPSDAEDLAQDLFVKVAAIQDRTIEQPSAYLYKLALNMVIDRQRLGARIVRRDQSWRQTTLRAVGDDIVDDAPSPEHAADHRLRLSKLPKVLGALPKRTQEIFRLHKLEGLSYDDVARKLGISRSAVEKHMMFALKQLIGAGLRDER